VRFIVNPPLLPDHVPVTDGITSVAANVCGFETPVAETLIVAVWVPASSAARLTDSVTLEGAVPLAGDRLSHVASSDAVQFSVPVPPLVMFNVWFAKAVTPVKLKLAGLREITG
jgi:hypothetical protein